MAKAPEGRAGPDEAPTGEPIGLRERKKQATRKLVSDVATRLFIARGFGEVTVEEIARAAGVSAMTVFNYFPRKEDLFFDRRDDLQALLRETLSRRGRLSPLAALRHRARALVEEGHPITRMDRDVVRNWRVVAGSASLQARALELLEEVERALARMLASSVGGEDDDPVARLLAAIVIGAFRVAFGAALRGYRSTGASRQRFLVLIERGFDGAEAAAHGTPYA